MAFKIDRRQFLIAGTTTAGYSTIIAASPLSLTTRLRIVGLKVDNLDQPMCLESARPHFSWQLQSEQRSVRQTAYRILVSTSKARLEAGRGNIWDSGRVESQECVGIAYQGVPLQSRQRCWWAVQVWDDQSNASILSEVSWWDMGLLSADDWSAQWLAVEDETTRADRESGMAWLWAPPPLADDAGPWIFRLTVHASESTAGGALVATVNDWYWWMQITRIWVDGEAVAGTGSWTNWRDPKLYESPGGLNHLAHQAILLPSMSRGRHVIAIEVARGETDLINELFGAEQPVCALAVFARIDLSNGRSMRLGRGSPWRVGLARDANAFRSEFDDRSWPQAVLVNLDGFEPWPEKPARLLRHSFNVAKPITRSRLYATALGAYEARLNGFRVGDALLTPEPAQYNKRALYQAYDVTAQLHLGENVLGLIVGEGWYGGFDGRFAYASPPLRVLAQLEIEYRDGTRKAIITGPGWLSTESPIRSSALKVGEFYDARFEQHGWDAPEFDDTSWTEVRTADAPSIELTAQMSPPARVIERLRPISITEVRTGTYVADFGWIFAGWCRLRANGSAGKSIELKFADGLKASGQVDQSHEAQDPTLAPRIDRFVLRGDPRGEIFEPRFTYRSFRYVEIDGLDTPLTAEALEGIVIHTDLKRSGRLHCSHPIVQKIDILLGNTLRANYVCIPVDNNIREMRGFLNDASCFLETAMFNYDLAAFIRRVMDNAVDRQTAAGMFPKNAPEPRYNNANFNLGVVPAGHAVGAIVLPWRAWRQYGDTGIIDRVWEPMRCFLDLILKKNPDHLWKRDHIDEPPDWFEGQGIPTAQRAPRIPTEVFATAYWAYAVKMVAEMAEATARDKDAIQLRILHRQIVAAFNQAYVKRDGTIGSGSQTCYVLALQFGLLPESNRRRAAQRLVAEIERCGNAITTGTLATEFILDVLVDNGYSRLAYDLLLRTDLPSWGYMIRHDATGIWETWDNQRANSQPAFGCIGGFLYRRIAGIAAGRPGFRSIVIRPVLDQRLQRAGAAYESVMGRIASDWSHTDGRFTLAVTIPPNTYAHVHLPATPGSHIREGRKAIAGHTDLELTQQSEAEVVLRVGSGSYSFTVDKPRH